MWTISFNIYMIKTEPFKKMYLLIYLGRKINALYAYIDSFTNSTFQNQLGRRCIVYIFGNLFNVWPNKEDSCVSHLLLHHQSVTISYQTASKKLQGTPTTEWRWKRQVSFIKEVSSRKMVLTWQISWRPPSEKHH